MKRQPFLILAILILFITGTAVDVIDAQTVSPVKIETLEVSLLPEFTQPSMQVIMRIRLTQDTSLPRELLIKIPADAALLALTLSERDGEQRTITADTVINDEWQTIRFTTPLREFQIEYNDPNLSKKDKQRDFEFQWLSTYPVESLSVITRQPYGANDITTIPSLTPAPDKSANLIQYFREFGEFPAGETFTLSLSYIKELANPAYPALDVVPAMAINETTIGRSASPLNVILWLLGLAVVVLIMVGLYYWWFRINILDKRDQVIMGNGKLKPEIKSNFCHECGMRSQVGDRYCRNCGTRLQHFSQNDNLQKSKGH